MQAEIAQSNSTMQFPQYSGTLTTTIGYSYDAVGNRLTQDIDGVVTNYGYDNANRLVQVTSPTSQVTSFVWDDNGNLLNDGVNTYVYDQANRLISVNGQTTFAYNGLGDRLRQTVGGVPITYVNDYAAGLTQVLSDGTNTYLYGVGRIAQYGTAMHYFGADGLGGVRQLYDTSGATLANKRYDPFGNVLSASGAGSVYGYTGEATDATGLVFLRARYLDPTQGRFTTRDTWEGDYNWPLTLNRWNYVEANPVRYSDPTGLFPTEQDINNDDAEFSCNCGWIDWNHVAKSDEVGFGLLDDLRYASQNFRLDPNLSNNWGIYVGISLGFGRVETDLFSSVAVVPNQSLGSGTRNLQLATSIFMSANEQFEENQGSLSWLPLFGGRLKSSYYSEEDLPSDIMGFFIASRRFSSSETSETVRGQIRQMCGAVGRESSLEVFRETYANGAAAITNWRNWYGRQIPLIGCNSGLCNPLC